MAATGARTGVREGTRRDPVMWVALAVILGSLGTLAWVYGEDRLSALLRILGAAAIGLAVGALVVAALVRVLSARRRALRLTALGVAAATALALTVPFALAQRAGELGGRQLTDLEPLRADDRVVSVPGTEAPSPILVLRADGTAQLIAADGTAVTDLGAAAGDAVGLTPDGRWVLLVRDGSTRIAPVDAPAQGTTVDGEPVALSDGVLALRTCDAATCIERGVDPAAPAGEPGWSIDVGPAPSSPDPEGPTLPAVGDDGASLVGTLRASGILPSEIVRAVAGQGWFWADPATGHLSGRRIAGADEPCRVVAPQTALAQDVPPPVLAVCTGEDGAVTARASADGAPLWESAPTAPGTWSASITRGRAIVSGSSADGAQSGLLVASEAHADWRVPGTEATAGSYRALVGVDGRDVVRIDDAGLVIDDDLVTGETVWTLETEGDDMRGALGAGTTVLIDDRAREAALDPAGARRVRVIDDATGDVVAQGWTVRAVEDLRPVSGGRALAQVGGEVRLLGGR